MQSTWPVPPPRPWRNSTPIAMPWYSATRRPGMIPSWHTRKSRSTARRRRLSGPPNRRQHRARRGAHEISIHTQDVPSLLWKVADLIGIRASRRYPPGGLGLLAVSAGGRRAVPHRGAARRGGCARTGAGRRRRARRNRRRGGDRPGVPARTLAHRRIGRLAERPNPVDGANIRPRRVELPVDGYGLQ